MVKLLEDELLVAELSHLLNVAAEALEAKRRNFWEKKSLQNHVGEFHQNILGSLLGWENLGTSQVGDLVSNDR